MHVLPSSSQRQAHEDGLDPGVLGVKAELGAAIMDEIELDISAATELLPALLLRGERHVFSLLDDGQVCRNERAETVGNERQQLLGILLVEVVEKYPTNTASLVTMGVEKILIAPFFKPFVVRWVMPVAGPLESFMEMDRVFVEEVGRGQVSAAAEPPSIRGAILVDNFEVTIIKMHSRSIGVVRMQDHTQSRGKKSPSTRLQYLNSCVRPAFAGSAWAAGLHTPQRC